ncbi:MAG TPA: thioredoxin family protein, partial [Candidatus Bathyarchaeia archaeon]|nr:thioredoxin family protein [Candidatus Bathyarchaeia archaeon]
MSKIIDEGTKAKLASILKDLVSPVKLVYFSQEADCPTCAQQLQLLEELAPLSDKLELKVYDLVLNGDEAINYRIDKVPATAVLGDRDHGIRFYGITAGYEFTSLLEAIIMISKGDSGLGPELEKLVESIHQPVHLQVLVTLTCPYCPKMVHVAHQFAFVNDNIRGDMVESSEFPQLVQRYSVNTVPKTVINESHSFEGALPAASTYLEVLKAVNPEEYARLEEALRTTQKERKAGKAEEGHLYDVVIVGG